MTAAGVLLAWTLAVAAHAAGPADVILISIDTLAADHLGCYGYGRATSPNLDAFGRRSTRFDAHISAASWTLPSHMSIFTSLVPSRHGARGTRGFWSVTHLRGLPFEAWAWLMARRSGRALPEPDFSAQRLRLGVRTLAQELKASGYSTGGFAAAEHLHARHGFARGYDAYMVRPWASADEQIQAALEWLKAARMPRFLFLHLYDLHNERGNPAAGPATRFFHCEGPGALRFVPPGAPAEAGLLSSFGHERLQIGRWTAMEREVLRGQYDGCIAAADRALGAFLDALRRLGLYDGSLIIVTSDHGENLGEAGRWGHREINHRILRVPLLLKAPGQDRGRVVKALTSSLDLMPTILEAAGASYPSVRERMQGRSLRPAAAGGPGAKGALSEETRPPRRSVTAADGWKLIQDVETMRSRLFDLKRDPDERRDLFDAEPERAASLEEALVEAYLDGPAGAEQRNERKPATARFSSKPEAGSARSIW